MVRLEEVPDEEILRQQQKSDAAAAAAAADDDDWEEEDSDAEVSLHHPHPTSFQHNMKLTSKSTTPFL